MTKPQLCIASKDYHQYLLASIAAAKQRILLETMDFDSVGRMKSIVEACVQAHKRGVQVTLIYDIHSYSNVKREYGQVGVAELQQWEHTAQMLGLTVHTVGARGLNPFAGRHHAKTALIDDSVYIGGGVNLTSSSFAAHDFMLRYDNAALAQTLYDALPQAALERAADVVLFADDTTEVLLDAGIKHRSLIYDRTCELAQKATKVWYVSMLAPDGQLVRLLQQKDTQYWYNLLSGAISFGKLAIIIDQIKARVPNNYRSDALLHAKFCVFQLPDGTYEAITGSHNFNSRGVVFGTQELAIHTKDQTLCAQLIEFANNLPR